MKTYEISFDGVFEISAKSEEEAKEIFNKILYDFSSSFYTYNEVINEIYDDEED